LSITTIRYCFAYGFYNIAGLKGQIDILVSFIMPLLIILRASPLCRIARHVRLTLRMSVRLFACSIHLLARLYFSLFCALNTGSLHLKLRSFISIRSVSADTVVLLMPLFLICLLFIFILFLRTGSASLPLRHVCANQLLARYKLASMYRYKHLQVYAGIYL
jgi:hypothetical protein